MRPNLMTRLFSWLLVPSVFVSVALWLLPLSEALRIGADEGYELIKASLMLRGHELYTQIWNDQPPLFSAILMVLFELCGERADIARQAVLCFSALLLVALAALAVKGSGSAAGLAAGGLLFSWAEFLPLSVSAMLEVPAMALGMASVALTAYLPRIPSRREWLFTSAVGFVFSLALETKLTSIIFVPPILWLICVGDENILRDSEKYSKTISLYRVWRREPRRLLWWGAGSVAGIAVVSAFFPGQFQPALWSGHAAANVAGSPAAGMGLKLSDLARIEQLLWLAGFGIVWLIIRRKWAALGTPLVFTVTVAAVHSINRPFWPYYLLHFALAAAWLGGAAIGDVIETCVLVWRNPGRQTFWVRLGCSGLMASSAMLVFGTMADGVRQGVAMVNFSPRLAHDPAIEMLKRHAGSSLWIFTDDPIYAFHAGLAIPPELAVVPRKRLWTGELSTKELIAHLRRYEPGQILLRRDVWREELREYIAKHYTTRGELGQGHYLLKKD